MSVFRWFGASAGPRFGPKAFRAAVRTDMGPRRLLGGLASALEQVVCGASQNQPWHVLRGARPLPGPTGGLRFSARGSYRWDNSPYVVHDGYGSQLTTQFDISGQSRSGSGQVLLEGSACPTADDEDQVVIELNFRENASPMWMKHESEELVACTVRGLVAPLAELLEAPVEWTFVSGDWLCNQMIDVPGEGVLCLARLRG